MLADIINLGRSIEKLPLTRQNESKMTLYAVVLYMDYIYSSNNQEQFFPSKITDIDLIRDNQKNTKRNAIFSPISGHRCCQRETVR